MGGIIAKRRQRAEQRAEELAQRYLQEDEEYMQQQEQLGERQERQREAIKHVMTYMYPYQNVNTRIAKHPKGSPKAGEKFMWITRSVGRSSFSAPREANYPECVTVDKEGNVYVSEHTDQETYKISSEEILAAKYVPAKPRSPPLLLKRTQADIAVEWEKIYARVDRYELQYQLYDEVDNWKTSSAFLFTNCGTLKDIKCNQKYIFRVRAHNMVGWGEYSDASAIFSSAPGPPERPDAPNLTFTSEFTIGLEWTTCNDNGSEIFCYTVRCKAEGPNNKWRDAFVGLSTNCTVTELDDNTSYFFQIFATNDIGRSDGSYNVTYTTKEAPLDISGPVLRRHGVWEEYYDSRRQACVYLNTKTNLRQKKTPFELRSEAKSVCDPDVEFRKKRYRFIRSIRKSAVHLERRQSRALSMSDDGLIFSDSEDATINDETPVSPTIVSVLALQIERERIFEDTFEQFQAMPTHYLSRRTRVEFQGEMGIDSGGLTKEWYLELARTFADKSRRLFRRTSNKSAIGIDPKAVIKLKHCGIPEFRFIGRIVGKSIFDRQLINVQFDRAILKSILGHPLTMEDLELVDPVYAKSLKWILENDITGIIDETFSSFRKDALGRDECVDLTVNGTKIVGGRNIDVTNDNKMDYVSGMVHFSLYGQVEHQLVSFLKGFYEIVPKEDVSCFTIEEIILLMNGREEIVVSTLAASSKYDGGIDESSDIVVWLWKVVEKMTKEMKTKFLTFVTGCPRIPLDGFDPQFTVTCSDDMEATALPRSHTCFNQLVLPPYHLACPGDLTVGRKTLKEKLLYAIEHAHGFHMT